jgi:hypothetical protein
VGESMPLSLEVEERREIRKKVRTIDRSGERKVEVYGCNSHVHGSNTRNLSIVICSSN